MSVYTTAKTVRKKQRFKWDYKRIITALYNSLNSDFNEIICKLDFSVVGFNQPIYSDLSSQKRDI